jgi:hypothetical protein
MERERESHTVHLKNNWKARSVVVYKGRGRKKEEGVEKEKRRREESD